MSENLDLGIQQKIWDCVGNICIGNGILSLGMGFQVTFGLGTGIWAKFWLDVRWKEDTNKCHDNQNTPALRDLLGLLNTDSSSQSLMLIILCRFIV